MIFNPTHKQCFRNFVYNFRIGEAMAVKVFKTNEQNYLQNKAYFCS